ncbi:MAG: histone deacetylase [Gammaproteobacteria bacterium]|nr:MAG: histone deacetylase [Gammaproteobacteria bacterium]
MARWFYLSHPACRLHRPPAGHPESPARLAAVETALEKAGLLARAKRPPVPAATAAQLARVHDPDYIAVIFAQARSERLRLLDPDTALGPFSVAAARRAAGAALAAVDQVLAGGGFAFCAVRPPGHHAERSRPMGFCLFNNIAVAAAHALAEHGLRRVAILDFDVHHGNGTQHLLGGRTEVLFCSTHRHPFYPFSGTPVSDPRVINVPLPAGSDGRVMRRAVEREWWPALERFAPELILVSAGFDAHRLDPLGGLAWETEDYAWLGAWIGVQAARHTGGRVVAVLEGGYHLGALGASAAAFVAALAGT